MLHSERIATADFSVLLAGWKPFGFRTLQAESVLCVAVASLAAGTDGFWGKARSSEREGDVEPGQSKSGAGGSGNGD